MSIPKISIVLGVGWGWGWGPNVHLQNKHAGGGGRGRGVCAKFMFILKKALGGQMSGSHLQMGGKHPSFIFFSLGGKCPVGGGGGAGNVRRPE